MNPLIGIAVLFHQTEMQRELKPLSAASEINAALASKCPDSELCL
jgi:hypothetical protein